MSWRQALTLLGKKCYIALVLTGLVLICLSLAACGGGSYGESHNYNAPAPYANDTLHWIRLESPGNYHTIIFACADRDGIYLDQADQNSVTVVADDPNCSPSGQILIPGFAYPGTQGTP